MICIPAAMCEEQYGLKEADNAELKNEKGAVPQ
jgi:hypothetical protein